MVLEGLCGKCLARLAFGQPSGEATGRRFGDYELIEEIARGGMGVVYKARQISLNRIVAVKMLLHGPFSSDDFVRRFKIEAEAAASLQHPNIVAIHEIGVCEGHHYFSMEYVEGCDLAELVRACPMAVRVAAQHLKAISDAVQFAHQHGVLHRDLKPSNVLLDMQGQPHITDFGLARLANNNSRLTLTGQALGSPSYSSPEQAAGGGSETGASSDVYSLGAILYHLLTGRPPFQGETVAATLLEVQQSEPIPPRRLNASTPPPLENICLKCLQKEPAKRYASAGELAADLGRFLANQPVLARPATSIEKARLLCRRHPVPTALSAALLLAVLAGLAGALWQWQRAVSYGRAVNNQLYAADINLAAQALERGEYGLARRTLDSLHPKKRTEDVRGFEWRYLWNLCRGDQVATLTGHQWIVTCLAFSPNGEMLASGGQDSNVMVWDVHRHRKLDTISSAGGSVWSDGFSPDGSRLLMGCIGGQVEVRDARTQQILRKLPGTLAAFSRTQPILAASQSSPFFWEPAGEVDLWNYETGEKLGQFGRTGRSLALSPDGRWLAVAGSRRDVALWDVPRRELRRTLEISQPVWAMDFSPDGRRLATCTWTNEALIWDLAGNAPPAKLRGHKGNVWSAIFSPDGKTITTTGSDETIRFWDATTLEPRAVLHGHENEIWCAAYSPDGRVLATGGKDGTVRLWPTSMAARGDHLPSDRDARPVFSPGGKYVLTTNPRTRRGELWNLERMERDCELPAGRAVGFTPDGSGVVFWQERGPALEVYSPREKSRRTVALAEAGTSELRAERIGFSPDWRTLFVIDSGGMVQLWDAGSGRLRASLRGPAPPIRAAALGPGGKWLAISVERENSVRRYEPESGKLLELAGHRDFVSGLGFSPDGARLASASMDGTLKLWDMATGENVATLPGHLQEATDVAFSPDGRTLASVGQKQAIKLWDLAAMRELFSLDMPEAGLFLEFSPDETHLAVATTGDTVRLLEAPAAP